ncbi:unnamed protein product [Ceratitis capitata]|uniref:(Mediterranean fruit fly) hypothetical protein n=1 Tax=Ceratitis capitata TaxID=7213 RepID=A0A811UDG3_CERCA|nr:unnamed protein product [Ceratitis capitata]
MNKSLIASFSIRIIDTSMKSPDSGGMVRDSSIDSRLDSSLSSGSRQRTIPCGPQKKKKWINCVPRIIIVATDMRASKKVLRISNS